MAPSNSSDRLSRARHFGPVRLDRRGRQLPAGQLLDLVLASEGNGLPPAADRLPLNPQGAGEFRSRPEMLDGVSGLHGRDCKVHLTGLSSAANSGASTLSGMASTLASRIRDALEKREGANQSALAKACNVSRATVTD